MKISKYILFVLSAAIILSSCSSLSISQKRYSRGLNIDWFASKDKKKETPATTIRVKKSETKVADKAKDDVSPAQVAVAEEVQQAAGQEATTAVIPSDNKKEGKSVAKAQKSQARTSHSTMPSRKEIREAKKAVSQAREQLRANAPQETNEVSTLILVILCIIAPLGILAVALHEGEINDKFFISILLHLLFILPGVIYSLLVCLDVI